MNQPSLYHSKDHAPDNVNHWVDDCRHGGNIRELCYCPDKAPAESARCSECQRRSPLAGFISSELQAEPTARAGNRTKRWLVSAAIWTGIITGSIVALLGIDSLPLDYGEILTIVGIWLMLGVLLGQNKPQGMPLKQYLNRRIGAVAACWFLFNVMSLLYLIISAGQDKPELNGIGIIGLLALSGTGLVLGFMAGTDREHGA